MRKTRLLAVATLAALTAAHPLLTQARPGGAVSSSRSSSAGSRSTSPSSARPSYTPSRTYGSGTTSYSSSTSPSAAAPSRQGSMSSQSVGSRGSRTDQPVSGAQSITRTNNSTVTPVYNNTAASGSSGTRNTPLPAAPASSPYNQRPANIPPAAGYGAAAGAAAAPLSFAQRHPVATGVAAGVGGAWLYNSLFNQHPAAPLPATSHSGYAPGVGSSEPGTRAAGLVQDGPLHSATPAGMSEGATPFVTMRGVLLSLLATSLLGFLVYRIYRQKVGRPLSMGGGSAGSDAPPATAPREPTVPVTPAPYVPATAPSVPATTSYTPTMEDTQWFVALLEAINAAWSNGDAPAMASFATPEMASYYKETLDGNVSQHVHNVVENVRDVQVSVKESWREGRVIYATCGMKWSALDYVVDVTRDASDAGYLVSGSRTVPVSAEEIWTFARHDEGDWIVSAVQQVA